MSKYLEHLEAEYQKAKYEYEHLQAEYGDEDPDVFDAYMAMQDAYNDLCEAEALEENPPMTSQNSSFYNDDDDDVYFEPADDYFDYTCSDTCGDDTAMDGQIAEWEEEGANNTSSCIDPSLQSSSEDDDLYCEDEDFCYARLPCGPKTTVVVSGNNETESPVGQKLLSDKKIEQAIAYNTDHHPNMVKTLEKALHVPHWERSPTGVYSAPLVQRIARLQQDANTWQSKTTKVKDRLVCPNVDGKLDEATEKYIKVYYFSTTKDAGQVDTRKIWPDVDWPEHKKFDHYNDICRQFGHEVKDNTATLLGIRGVMLFAAKSRHRIGDHAKAYDDSFILLDYSDGNKKVREFSGATHAYQVKSSAAPNTDGRGRPDVGSIRDFQNGGLYEIQYRNKKGNYHICIITGEKPSNAETWTRGFVPAYRDTGHVQCISEADKRTSLSRRSTTGKDQDPARQVITGLGDYANGVLFHPGYTAKTLKGKAFSSISCQTARGEDVNFLALLAKKKKKIDYLLVEAVQVVSTRKYEPISTKEPEPESNQEDDIQHYVETARQWEGSIPHLYQDTRGLITVGIGNLTNTLAEAQALPFVNTATGNPATAAEIETNFNAVRRMTAGLRASRYRQNPSIELSEDVIDQLAARRIEEEFLPAVRDAFSGFDGYPLAAKEVIVDIAYNVGANAIRRWSNLIAHCEAHDWRSAATETEVRSSSASRNNWRRTTMQSAGN